MWCFNQDETSCLDNFKMAEVSGQTILNEAALKRLDPYVKEVLDTAKFVALYTFKLKENKWEKTGVEGSLFVYSRTGEPFYNILVLNRLNTNNLIEPISSKLTLQLHEPFLLYLNSKCCLYGIWFYEKEECTRLASLIESLMKELGDGKESRNNVKPPNGSCIDICNILTRAEEAYKSSKCNGEGNGSGVGKAREESDQTPQSVVDFFAKAGSAPKNLILSPQQFPFVPGRSRSLPEGDNGCHSPVNPLIHQLMSNPVHLVEHIEKQQRMAKTEVVPCNKVLKSFLKEPECNLECGKKGESENGSVPSQVRESVFFDCKASNLTLNPERSAKELEGKPELMPPAMFTPQNHKECDDFKVEPLTRNQLIQAINYLLKNDPVFMTKIHEAYVKSLTDRVL